MQPVQYDVLMVFFPVQVLQRAVLFRIGRFYCQAPRQRWAVQKASKATSNPGLQSVASDWTSFIPLIKS